MTTTIIGQTSADVTETSPPDGTQNSTVKGDSNFPVGLFTTIIGVGWSSGYFVAAGTSFDAQGNQKASMAVSKDGVKWTKHTVNGPSGASANAGIYGNNLVVVGGALLTIKPWSTDDRAGNPISGRFPLWEPAFFVSKDKGKTWKTLAIGGGSFSIAPGAVATFTGGAITGVGYDKKSKTFYGVGLHIQADGVSADGGSGGTTQWTQQIYTGNGQAMSPGSSGGQVSDGNTFTPIAPDVGGALLVDTALALNFDTNAPIYDVGGNKFASATAPGQTTTTGTKNGSGPSLSMGSDGSTITGSGGAPGGSGLSGAVSRVTQVILGADGGLTASMATSKGKSGQTKFLTLSGTILPLYGFELAADVVVGNSFPPFSASVSFSSG